MKPSVYLQLLDSSLRYLAVNPRNQAVLDRGEVVFEAPILSDRQVSNRPLVEARLDALVREKKWRQAKAHILLMDDFVVIKEEAVPPQLKMEEVQNYLNLQMNDTIRIPFDKPVFEYEILGRAENEIRVVLIAYPGEFIEEYKRILKAARLKPELADVSCLSLYRLAEDQGLISKEEGEHTLILQLDPYSMNMSMFHRDQPTFSRDSYSEVLAEMWVQSKDAGWRWRHSDIDRDLMLNEQFDEIDRFISFYSNTFLGESDQIAQFILSGSYPDLSHAKGLLERRFNLEPQLLELPQELDQSFATLYGLSLKKKTRSGKQKKALEQQDKQMKQEQKQQGKKQKKQKKEKKAKVEMQEEVADD
ncbi:MAG: pilus assembly protein PilM [Clostridiaceae bacterium]|nr:pilus assembly protein PilM [Clostridiaceae bacterium]